MATPSDIDLIWSTMRILDRHFGWFSARAVIDILGSRNRVNAYIGLLRREQVIAADPATGPSSALRYRIQRHGEAPPLLELHGRNEEKRQALWTAMRGLRQFTASELSLVASTPALGIGTAATPFLRALEAAGYVDRIADATFRLRPARNTGPRAPVLLPDRSGVFDLNLMRTVNVTASRAGNHETGNHKTGRAA